jgi:serine/threonine protein kinase
MAEVYLARRRAAGVEKWLVVKRMRPERSGDPRFLDLFVREARLSMSLVHQNIVPVFDFGRIDDQVFLAMERVEGRDLGSCLARDATHRMPPLLAAFVAAECCQALDYAHQRKGPDGVALGIVHRDVTPRNVLLSWSGEVKLTDFGIAALAGEATSRLLGTPQYMAPEQARSEPIDPRADIYAIGLVLRESLSGIRPRPGADRESILDAARRGALLPWPRPPTPPAPPADLALGSDDLGPSPPDDPRDLPSAALVAIVERATAGAPADRYPDARSMLEDLDHYIVGERARHKADSPARQLAAWLSGIWDGARDDVEADAAVDADHLVSFLDDGAFDIIGTGTVRSLAVTAADDVHADPSPDPPVGPTPRRASDSGGRSTKISSSNSTVAAGSFEAIPARGGDRDGDRDEDRATAPAAGRNRRSIVPLASMLAIGAAAVVAIIAVTGSGRARNSSTGESPTAAQPAAAQPPAPSPPAPSPIAPSPIAPSPATPSPTAPPPTRVRPAIPQQPGEPRAVASAKFRGPDQAAPAAAAGSNQVTCRVRINLTPWAYYTVDHDTTRHETPGIIDLAPGEHRLHVWNPELHIERDIVLAVPADRDTMTFSEPLQPPALHPDAGSP